MTIINYSDAQNNFKSIMEKVNQDHDEIIVTSKDDNNVVVMSEESYHQLIETVYLLNNTANIRHLTESIEQYNQGKTVKLDE